MNLLCPKCGSLVSVSNNRYIINIGVGSRIINTMGYKCPSCSHENATFDLLTEGGWINKKRTELIDKILDD